MPIITSLLDTDLYKFTMAQAALHRAPNTDTVYAFKCRSDVDLRPFENEIREEIYALENLQFTGEELAYLKTRRFLTADFIEFLSILRLTPRTDVEITAGPENLDITIRGTWHMKIWYEIYILAIVAEVYHRNTSPTPDYAGGLRRLHEKCDKIIANVAGSGKEFRLIEFGTRRRFSKEWQHEVTKVLVERLGQEPNLHLFGTSNVEMAMRYGLRPIGTMAHELFQAAQGMNVRLEDSQKHALEMWTQEFRGDLGIALTDIFGFDAFLADFDLFFAKLFDGARHDSGCPFAWTEKLLAHYRNLNIDARSKAAVYSDGLNIEKALALWAQFEGQIRTSFGIGTDMTCDIPGVKPLQIVIKMVECNGAPVAKLSDSEGKEMCRDAQYVAYLRTRIAHKIQAAKDKGYATH